MSKMELPVIIVNFKAYESAVGEKAVELAKIHETVSRETGVTFAVCVQAVDLQAVVNAVSIPVFAQHIDPISFGSGTGHVLPEAVKAAGAYGTLLNHAERQIPENVIEESIKRAKELGIATVVCANTPEMGARLAKYNPDFIAVEPPELIGGEISVSTAQPEVVKKAVDLIGDGKVLVGAGVKNGEDVKIAIELGAVGVLLASGVTKAVDPYSVLKDLAKGIV
ncbi:triose-phosphate isomerase [Patescibacteria group bacterium]|nr:triose-phosphate isomerase [Patescibacteria group bacterium]